MPIIKKKKLDYNGNITAADIGKDIFSGIDFNTINNNQTPKKLGDLNMNSKLKTDLLNSSIKKGTSPVTKDLNGNLSTGFSPLKVKNVITPTQNNTLDKNKVNLTDNQSQYKTDLNNQVNVTNTKLGVLNKQKQDILNRFQGSVTLKDLEGLNQFQIQDKIKELQLNKDQIDKINQNTGFTDALAYQDRNQKRTLALFDKRVEDTKINFDNQISDAKQKAELNNQNAQKIAALTGTSFSSGGLEGLNLIAEQGNKLISRLQQARDSSIASLNTQRVGIVDQFSQEFNRLNKAQENALNSAKTSFLNAAFKIDADLGITSQRGLDNLIKIKNDFLDRERQTRIDTQNEIMKQLDYANRAMDLTDKIDNNKKSIFQDFVKLDNLQNMTADNIVQFSKNYGSKAGEIANQIMNRTITNTSKGIDSQLQKYGINAYSTNSDIQAKITDMIHNQGMTPTEVSTKIIGDLLANPTELKRLQDLGLSEAEKIKRQDIAIKQRQTDIKQQTVDQKNNTIGGLTPSGSLVDIPYTTSGGTQKNIKVDKIASNDLNNALSSLGDVVIGSTYRTNAEQTDLYNKYKAGTGGLAAKPGTSKHENGLAIDIYKNNNFEPLDSKQVATMNDNGWYQTAGQSDLGHFQYLGKQFGEVTLTDIMSFNNSTFKPQKDLQTQSQKEKYKNFLDKKSAVMQDPNAKIEDILKYSAGGKSITDTPGISLEKFDSVISQLSSIQEQIAKIDTGPVSGRLLSLNLYKVDPQVLKASLTALIPNLARGVYGEVGVLTDNDVRLYAQTIPNLQSTKEVNQAILAMTLKIVAGGYKKKLQALAARNMDVSGFRGLYDNLQGKVKKIEDKLGMTKEAKNKKAKTLIKNNNMITENSDVTYKQDFLNNN